MACNDNKISNNCGNIVYASCTKFEGTTNTQSELSEEQCLSIEETTQDIYNQLEDLSNRVGGNPVVGTVTSVNNINPDVDGNITLDSDDVPQGTTNLYATTAEKATWNGKQNALGFVPVPETRTINSIPLTSNITLTKTSIGLSNVPNIDTTNPSNIVQDSTHRFVTDAQIATWNTPIDNSVIEVTYNGLLTLRNNSLLEVNKVYLITDYMTTYIQPITLVSKSSGIVEPLYVVATDINKLHNVAKSKLYPQDIVYYEITGDIGNGAGTEGFTKGKIYRRIDTLRSNDIGTDWRHIKYDRAGLDKLLFEDYTDCKNNTIKEVRLFNNVVGTGFANNFIEAGFISNTIGDDCTGNLIKQDFQLNTIGDLFSNNDIKSNFTSNNISSNFSNNVVDSYCINNTIGGSFVDNVIKNNYNGNTIGLNFTLNVIGGNFTNNIILNNFTNTVAKQLIAGVDFSTADIYSKNYTNTITRRPNGTFEFSYIDNFGDVVTEEL